MMPFLMIVVVVATLYFSFGRGGPKPPRWYDFDRPSGHAGDSETAIEVL